jgi:hypothetical protein
VAKCAYRGERIRGIEEKWIDENVEDEEERRWRRDVLGRILMRLEANADCTLDAIPGGEFCIFHDPNHWREHADEARNEFQKRLKEGKEGFFIGFHLPNVEFPEVCENNLHMELVKFHARLEASSKKFEGLVYFDGATFLGVTEFFDVTFKKSASFIGVTFKELASFLAVNFYGGAWFDHATFKERTLFNGVFLDRHSLPLQSFSRKHRLIIRHSVNRHRSIGLHSTNRHCMMGQSFSEEHRFIAQFFPDLLALRILSFCPTCSKNF